MAGLVARVGRWMVGGSTVGRWVGAVAVDGRGSWRSSRCLKRSSGHEKMIWCENGVAPRICPRPLAQVENEGNEFKSYNLHI